MNSENINFNAYKYAESNLNNLTAICNPLFSSGIKVFAYFRFFNNGKYLYLCNRLDWVEFCLRKIQTNDDTDLGEKISHANDEYYCYLWPLNQVDYLMSALYSFDIWNGLSIFKQSKDFVELWGFATNKSSTNMQNFYIDNIEKIKDFTAIFSLSAYDIVNTKPQNLAVYSNFKEVTTLSNYDYSNIEHFIKNTEIQKKPIIVGSKEIFFSNNELLCINKVASGLSAKYIAQELNISYRTVEKYLEKVKQKAGVNNKADLIKLYKNSVLNWL